jgi:hypothetical protein
VPAGPAAGATAALCVQNGVAVGVGDTAFAVVAAKAVAVTNMMKEQSRTRIAISVPAFGSFPRIRFRQSHKLILLSAQERRFGGRRAVGAGVGRRIKVLGDDAPERIARSYATNPSAP